MPFSKLLLVPVLDGQRILFGNQYVSGSPVFIVGHSIMRWSKSSSVVYLFVHIESTLQESKYSPSVSFLQGLLMIPFSRLPFGFVFLFCA